VFVSAEMRRDSTNCRASSSVIWSVGPTAMISMTRHRVGRLPFSDVSGTALCAVMVERINSRAGVGGPSDVRRMRPDAMTSIIC